MRLPCVVASSAAVAIALIPAVSVYSCISCCCCYGISFGCIFVLASFAAFVSAVCSLLLHQLLLLLLH
jgi:inner membrane protein involved in colicin E2 resistance